MEKQNRRITIAVAIIGLILLLAGLSTINAKPEPIFDSITVDIQKQTATKLDQIEPQHSSQLTQAVKKVETTTSSSRTPNEAQNGSKASGSLGEWLSKLGACESGGNYQTNTGNGYYGKYQFSIATWNSHNTGYARADLAPPAVQDATIVKNTLRAPGGLATQNPGCFRSQGLSQFPPS